MGGSLPVSDNQLVGVVGMTSKSFPILISSNTIGVNLDIEVPLVSDIKTIQNEVEFSGIQFKTKGKDPGAPFALLHPFLTRVTIETSNNCPKFLFHEFMTAMFTFDLENPMANKDSWVESGRILQFLWEACKSLLLEANFDSTADEVAIDWQELRSNRGIFEDPTNSSAQSSLPTTSLSSTLALSTSIQAQIKLMEKMQDSVK